jgi:hypothetical protein
MGGHRHRGPSGEMAEDHGTLTTTRVAGNDGVDPNEISIVITQQSAARFS